MQDDSDTLPAEPVCSPIATRTRIRQAAKQRHSDSDNGGAFVDISEPAVCLATSSETFWSSQGYHKASRGLRSL